MLSVEAPAASGMPKLRTVTVLSTGTPTGEEPKSSADGLLMMGTGGPASSPAAVKRFVDEPPGPETTKLLPFVPPVTVCGVRPSPMWFAGRAGSGVHVRNGPISPDSAPSKAGHGASAQPLSCVTVPRPRPSVSIVILPNGCCTVYVVFGTALLRVTRTRMKAAGPLGGLTASWARTS